jgi:DNA-directed RNA polymerase beta' subunit
LWRNGKFMPETIVLQVGDVIQRNGKSITVKNTKEELKKGDRITRNGEYLKVLKYSKQNTFELQLGDVVDRQLQNGDYGLLNRQPTLHKASMMAMKVILKPYKTLRFNLSICKPFNADFDKKKC